ncbi:MAG: hypothetical protein V9G19_09130 [Tetrasphaera sp.]
MLLGLVRPTSGTVRVLEGPAGRPETMHRIGALIEGPGFYPFLSGRDNLRVMARYRGLPESDGYLLGTVTRSPALSVGFGLLWALVVENLLRGVAGLLGAVETFTHLLPGTAAGSLVGAFGEQGGDGTPGVLTVLSGTRAAWTLSAYAVLLPVLAVLVIRRRDE